MSTTVDPTDVQASTTASSHGAQRKLTKAEQRAIDAKAKLSSPAASYLALAVALLWTIPTLGLFITSIRTRNDVTADGWWNAFVRPLFTGFNYQQAFQGGLAEGFLNTFVITIPAVVIPIVIALLAAYAFAWIEFPGRNILFVAMFALQVVPIQVTLIPLLNMYVDLGIAGSFWPVWLSHTMFGLPLAIFLLHNFMKDVPASLIEAARVDGAGHVLIFFKVLMPLLVPAIAAFFVFQFLWVWNDLLVALTFANNQDLSPLTARVADLAGTRGNAWYLLAPGAFIAMLVPLVVFLGLQRFFVRGLLAGSVKG